MSQDINSIIKQLAEIDSASAKILQKTQDEKAQYAEMIKQQKRAFDEDLSEKERLRSKSIPISIRCRKRECFKTMPYRL